MRKRYEIEVSGEIRELKILEVLLDIRDLLTKSESESKSEVKRNGKRRILKSNKTGRRYNRKPNNKRQLPGSEAGIP